jgi:hypothetical protein
MMKSNKIAATLVVSLILFQAMCFAADDADKKIEIGGRVSIENGQFVKSNYAGASLPYKPWINNEVARISLLATLSDHVTFVVAPEVRMWFDNFNWIQMGSEAFAFPFSSHTTVSLANAQGIMTYGEKETYSFEFAAGVMPYKYNSDAKNLGEYLFRSSCHPAYVVTSFDNAFVQMTGLKLNSVMFNKLTLDLFLSTETVFLPTLDWSVSLLAGYRPLPSLEVGAGIMLDRLLPIDSTRERPSTSTDGINKYYSADGEADYYSFGGTKLMARFGFDPKKMFPGVFSAGMFGREDFKIYGEAAALGLKSITPYRRVLDSLTGLPVGSGWAIDSSKNFYDDITQRIPVMVGFNIPTFSGFLNKNAMYFARLIALDYLSLELEWYGWPYNFGYGDVNNFRVMYPIPPSVQDYPGGDPLAFKEKDNWKYSINLKKTVVNGFSIIGQVARDHTHYDAYYTKYNTGYFSSEAFTLPDDWGWWVKLQYTL